MIVATVSSPNAPIFHETNKIMRELYVKVETIKDKFLSLIINYPTHSAEHSAMNGYGDCF